MDKTYWSKRAKALTPYVPGEQPKGQDLIKLNTNENPYPPSPRVAEAIASCGTALLSKYPPTDGGAMRDAAAAIHGVPREMIFCGNGSDEVLAFAFQAFFDETSDLRMPEISYSFYPVWADAYGIPYTAAALDEDFLIDVEALCGGSAVFANPNAPTGIAMPLSDVERIAMRSKGVVLVDEAYVAFGGESAVGLLGKYPNLLVVRTMSKSHSLAGMRVGYAIGASDLIAALEAVRDSFNSYPVDRIAGEAAAASLLDREYTAAQVEAIKATRDRTAATLKDMGFYVTPSCTNFLFCKPPVTTAEELCRALRARNIFVRWFSGQRVRDYLRVTIGTDREMDAFLRAVREIVC